LLRQRVYGLACGYEDLNDHDTLRNDIAFQTAVEKDQALGSRSTLCRFEQRADRGLVWRVHALLVRDGAGWHRSAALVIPDNLTRLHLPAYSPELNTAERL
jgi:hypothetical protein